MRMSILLVIATTLGLAGMARADLTQTVSGTFTWTGVNWPQFTCGFSCAGVTTTTTGSVLLPKFPGGGVLTGVRLESAITIGGSYSGLLADPHPGSAAVSVQVNAAGSATPSGASPVTGSTVLTGTVNAMNQPFISVPLADQEGSSGPITLPSALLAAFIGPGTVTIPVKSVIQQTIASTGGACTGAFALHHKITVTIHYDYVPANLGGGTVGQAGSPLFSAFGSLEPNAALQLALTHAAPNSPVLLAVAAAPGMPVQIGGGAFYPLPTPVMFAASSDSLGSLSLPVTIPSTTPPGISAVLQFVISDFTTSTGFALSNALQLVTAD